MVRYETSIEVLADEFTRDVERLVRFEREARILASLDQSNIASICEIGAAVIPTSKARRDLLTASFLAFGSE